MDNVRHLRREKSWSQHDLAHEARVRQALVSAIEVGTANPTLFSIEKIASALQVSVADLFSDKSR